MLKVWRFAFDAPAVAGGPGTLESMIPLLGLVAVSVALALAAGPVFSYAEATAAQLLDVDAYVTAVAEVPGPRPAAGGVRP